MLEEKASPQRETLSRQTARWDAQNIFKNYFVLVGTQIGGAFFSFATVWIATRLYSTEGYGSIVAIIAGSQAMQLLTNWTNIALTRYGVEEFVETGKITNTFWSRAAIFTPNVIIIASTAPFWIYWLSSLLHLPSTAGPFIILHFVFSVIWLHFQQALQALKMPRFQGLLIFLERVVVFLLVVLLGFFLKLSWLYSFYAFITSSFLMSAIAWWNIRHLISWKVSINKHWIGKLLAFSIPLFPYSLTSFFCTNYLDTFFITKYLSKSELGIYSVGYQINSLLLQFLILIGTLLMPMFVTLRTKKLDKYINEYLENVLPLITLLWGVTVPFLAILIGYVIPLIFGAKFSNLQPIIWIFMVGTTFTIPSVIGYSPFATAASAVYISFPMTLVIALANFIGDFIMIPRLGLIGSAWATFISSATGMITIVLLIRWKFKFRTKSLLISVLPSLVGLILFFFGNSVFNASILIATLSICLVIMNLKEIAENVSYIFNLKTVLNKSL